MCLVCVIMLCVIVLCVIAVCDYDVCDCGVCDCGVPVLIYLQSGDKCILYINSFTVTLPTNNSKHYVYI